MRALWALTPSANNTQEKALLLGIGKDESRDKHSQSSLW